MSYGPNNTNYPYDNYGMLANTSFKDHTIQGKMIVASFVMPPLKTMTDDEIKQLIIGNLAIEMAKQNCVEFTKMMRHDGDIEIKARIYVTSSDKVFILRTYGGA